MVHAIAYATETRSFDPNRQLFLENNKYWHVQFS